MGEIVAVERVLGGRYQVEQVLGSGGMATVWLGRDLRLDRRVAIKELAGTGLSYPMALERFDREARAVARLSHPNIVAVYDVGADDGHPYLVMELVEGRSVQAMLAGGPLSLAAAVAIAAQTCDGLGAAHAAGVIHRDIKPGNLMVTSAGVVKVCDFGVARLQDAAGQTNLTAVGGAVGSSSYMAPEQATGGVVDARTDLYALGCTLYAMLAGAPPFVGDNPMVVLHYHLTRAPAPLHEERADIPPALEALVHQLLAKTPDDRPADVAQVRERLAALDADPATKSAPGSVPGLAAIPNAVVLAAAIPADPQASPVDPASQRLASKAADDGPPAHGDDPQGDDPQGDETAMAPQARRLILVGTAVLLMMISLLVVVTARSPFTAEQPLTAAPAGTASPSSAPGPSTVPATTVPQATESSQPRASARPQTTSQPAPFRTTATANAPAPAPEADPIVALRLSIRDQVQTGNLNPDKAPELYKKVDEIASAIHKGDAEEATKKTKELREKLARLRKDGNLSAAGYTSLLSKLEDLT